MMRRFRSARIILVAAAIELFVSAAARAQTGQTARERYEQLVARDSQVRASLQTAPKDASAGPLTDMEKVVAAYEALVRKFPTSGYADNALWQAATIADAAYQKFGRVADFDRSIRLYRWLTVEYPTSVYVPRAKDQRARLDKTKTAREAEQTRVATVKPPASSAAGNAANTTPLAAAPIVPPAAAAVAAPVQPIQPAPLAAAPSPALPVADGATLTSIQRVILPDSVRVTLELDREVTYREERLSGPARVFFDMKGVQPTPALKDKVLSYPDDVVNKIRVGRHPDDTVRVVLDLENVKKYSVFTLYNPFRLVIDCERNTPRTVTQSTVVAPSGTEPAPIAEPKTAGPAMPPPIEVTDAVPLPPVAPPPAPPVATPVATPAPAPASPAPSPSVPEKNGAGGFSIARQLGLGVSRIVIDPGHGGHDPGAQGKGLDESELVLDVALRLEKLLLKEPGLEVTLTRRTDVFIPLEERTAIANRQNADLFLSIHANASVNITARGIETYFLSFAASPDAAKIAARENAASGQVMHNLPDIIKAISLNNKLDESRDFAHMVQEAMFGNLAKTNKGLRDLGVKKAPFVVLIGAGMPSVLSEISFITNKQDLQLLKSPAYKDKIAQSLAQAVLRYRRSLKGTLATNLSP